LHGWLDDWDLEGSRRLSWGCVVMRNADIRQLFDRVPLGAMVVIF
jgi:lipoprotein-anchoring transpeptidase ErfK/SrfK